MGRQRRKLFSRKCATRGIALEPSAQGRAGRGWLSVSVAKSSDGKWLASGNNAGEICLWDLATRVRVAKFRAHRALAYALAFSPDRGLLATGGADRPIHLWGAGTTNKVRTLRGHLHEVWSLDFSPDGQTLVSASKDGTARLWRVDSGPRRTWTFPLATNEMVFGPLPDINRETNGFRVVFDSLQIGKTYHVQ